LIRILHTSDWHLGHTLHGVSREYEHREFLAWLLDTIENRCADALIVAGDIFDSANPPASAQALFYRFVVEARERFPRLDIAVAGGNHDSPGRLEAPSPLLEALGVRIVGAFPRCPDGTLDAERLIVPLRDRFGDTAALCALVPFLRPSDLHPAVGDDPLVEGVRALYGEVGQAALAQRRGGQSLVTTGHCYVTGGRLSQLSERKILGGNQHALPIDLFLAPFAYAALGHLHLAQKVGGHAHVRFSGSPLPLSLSESAYPHQVVEIELEGGLVREITSLPVPRSVEILNLPSGGPLPPEEVESILNALDLPDDLPAERHPLVEVSVLLERPEPGLRYRLEEALSGKAVRLLKVSAHYPGVGAALAETVSETLLQDLHPDEVFLRCYRRRHDAEPTPELFGAFHALVDAVRGGEGER
jgi:DNA repair protein SbcD/Mre11